MYKIVKSLNIFSETVSTVFTRFHIGPSIERMLTVCSNGSAPLNKMAAMPIYGKHLKISFSRTRKALRLNRAQAVSEKKTLKNYTILYMYIAQKQGQITPRGQNFDSN